MGEDQLGSCKTRVTAHEEERCAKRRGWSDERMNEKHRGWVGNTQTLTYHFLFDPAKQTWWNAFQHNVDAKNGVHKASDLDTNHTKRETNERSNEVDSRGPIGQGLGKGNGE